MLKIAVFLSDGCEEIEALTPVDVLRRADVKVDTFSIFDNYVTGSHQIVIKADYLIKDFNIDNYDGVVIPGGMPGAKHLSLNSGVVAGIKKALEGGKLVSAICASPAVVLGGNNLVGDKKVTCYPADVFTQILGDNYTGSDVEIDGNLITANGPRSALAFAMAICKYLGVQPKF